MTTAANQARHLLALAADPAATVHEARNALGQLLRLMRGAGLHFASQSDEQAAKLQQQAQARGYRAGHEAGAETMRAELDQLRADLEERDREGSELDAALSSMGEGAPVDLEPRSYYGGAYGGGGGYGRGGDGTE